MKKVNYKREWQHMNWNGRLYLIQHFFGKHFWDEDDYCWLCGNDKNDLLEEKREG